MTAGLDPQLGAVLERDLPSLLALARVVSCNFVDARTTSKDVVRSVAQNHAAQSAGISSRIDLRLSTCLRYECYRCDGAGYPDASFFHATGLTCVRRLLSVITGLQSEIVGEQEILLQVSDAIRDACRADRLSKMAARGFDALLAVGTTIRARSGVNSHENYSTAAADLIVEHLTRRSSPTVAIVGGGYMAEAFFTAMLRARFANVRNILWINRSVAKLQRSLTDLIELLDVPVELLDLEEGNYALVEADAVFCALAASPGRYIDARHRHDAFVVDVSYPPVFGQRPGITLVNIANTDFSRMIKAPVPKSCIVLADRHIDDIMAVLEVAG